MSNSGGVNGVALSATAVGVLLIWSGIKGWSLLGTAGDLVNGSPASGTVTNPLTAPGGTDVGSAAGGAAGTVGSSVGSLAGMAMSDLASVARSYEGHAYSYGGAPGPDGSKPWDCSSFVNFCASVRLGRAIPGYGPGQYKGTVHGPPTGSWGVWSGLTSVSRSQVQADDLIVWTGHMGVAIDNNNMISALNAREGTKVTPIEGHGNGPLLRYGRYK